MHYNDSMNVYQLSKPSFYPINSSLVGAPHADLEDLRQKQRIQTQARACVFLEIHVQNPTTFTVKELGEETSKNLRRYVIFLVKGLRRNKGPKVRGLMRDVDGDVVLKFGTTDTMYVIAGATIFVIMWYTLTTIISIDYKTNSKRQLKCQGKIP